jgi:hypothetical protein
MAYYDTLSFVVDQGEALGLSKDDLGLKGYSPASLLKCHAA